MNSRNHKKRLEFQQKMISRQSEHIEKLKLEISELKLIIEEKNMIINSVESLRKELADNVGAVKGKKNEYEKLIKELKDMKKILNQTVYKGRWRLVRLLIK